MYTLHDFELGTPMNALERAKDFQKFTQQFKAYPDKHYWIEAYSGVDARMELEGSTKNVASFIANDYLGMSQRLETIEAGIEAVRKYGTGT